MTEEIQIFENRQVRSIWDLVTIYKQLKLVFSTPKVELTDEITKAWSGFTTRQYKQYKGLKKAIDFSKLLSSVEEKNIGGESENE